MGKGPLTFEVVKLNGTQRFVPIVMLGSESKNMELIGVAESDSGEQRRPDIRGRLQ
jgi:hypothetical protein